jgi:hypothetical protein
MTKTLCGLCGEYCKVPNDQASHDGDGLEPCVNGHYGCSMTGRTGGPCLGEEVLRDVSEDDLDTLAVEMQVWTR